MIALFTALRFLPIRWIFMGLISVIFLGYVFILKHDINQLEESVNEKNKEIAGLYIGQDRLLQSNQSLQNELKRRQNEFEEILAEQMRVKAIKDKSKERTERIADLINESNLPLLCLKEINPEQSLVLINERIRTILKD